MPSQTPSRYGASVGRPGATLQQAARTIYAGARLAIIEYSLFGSRMGAVLRFLVSCRLKRRLQLLESWFDAAFYVRQFSDHQRRERVGRGPLLHYVLVGWCESRSPMPSFDPVFYRRANPDLGSSDEPLWHYANLNDVRRLTPCNETAHYASMGRWQSGRRTVVTVHHARGGGSSRFLDLFEQELWAKGWNILRLRAVAGSPTLGVIEDLGADDEEAPSIVFDLATDRSRLVEFARRRGVTRLLVNHLIDRPPEMAPWIEDLAHDLGCNYDVILHDYYVLCPRVDMVNGRGRFCDVAPPEDCVRCVAQDGSEVAHVDPLTWRASFTGILARAGTIFVPSEDTARRVAPYVATAIQVWSPENDLDLPSEQRPTLAETDALRVAILGALNVPKGLRVLASLARATRLAGAPLTFTLVGPASDPALLADEGVGVTGAYKGKDLDRLIDDAAPHIVFLPAIWPETWSFVLTVALRRGLSVVAFDIGAPAERLRRLARGHLLALDLAERPADLLSAFLTLREQLISR